MYVQVLPTPIHHCSFMSYLLVAPALQLALHGARPPAGKVGNHTAVDVFHFPACGSLELRLLPTFCKAQSLRNFEASHNLC